MKLRRNPSRGFTLFEVILASALFVLLAGGVYFAVATSMSAASEAGQVQMEARKTGAFVGFLKDGFLNLPSDAEISVRSGSGTSGAPGMELLIKRALNAFETGALENGGSGVVLATVPDRRGLSSFSLARFPEKLNDSEGERSHFLARADWLPVLENIQYVRWRFWDSTSNRFVETWDRGTVHPKLIEFTFKLAGEPANTCLFWLPPLMQAANNAKAPVAPKKS